MIWLAFFLTSPLVARVSRFMHGMFTLATIVRSGISNGIVSNDVWPLPVVYLYDYSASTSVKVVINNLIQVSRIVSLEKQGPLLMPVSSIECAQSYEQEIVSRVKSVKHYPCPRSGQSTFRCSLPHAKMRGSHAAKHNQPLILDRSRLLDAAASDSSDTKKFPESANSTFLAPTATKTRFRNGFSI